MKKVIEIALSQYGVKEVKGTVDNPAIVKYFDDLGYDGKKLKDETSWCSAFANWCAKKAGLPFTGKLNARSWLRIGKKTDTPEMGDIVVLWRESKSSWKGHVGFFIREDFDFIYMLGGNQKNQVCISAYPKERLLSYIKID